MIRRLFLEEGKVGLTKLLPGDAQWLETWVNDPATTRYMATGRTQTTVDTLAAQIAAWKEPKDWPFAVICDGEPIGTVGLYDTDFLSRKAEFRILLGAPYCGKGYGTVATRLAIRFGFDRLGLHRVWLGVTALNERAVRAYQKAGFFAEGLLRDDLYRDGQYYDSLRMAILRSNYEGQSWVTEKVKPAETSESGHDTPKPASEPSSAFWRQAAV